MTHLSLRKSCDRCHEAKVKCTFDGFSFDSNCCTRCRSRGSECARSQSKPYGRIPGSRNKKRKMDRQPHQEPTPSFSRDGGSTSPYADINANEFWDLLDGKPGTNKSPPVDSNLTTPPYDWLDTNALSGTLFDFCSPLDGLIDPKLTSSPLSAACQCIDTASEALSSLPQPATAFDNVLKWTQTATWALRSFLACESAHGASVPLVFHNLTQTIVATFREALHTSCTWPQPIWSCEKATRIQMGSCTIDADGEDGAALRRQVALFGLRKVDSLVEQLVKQDDGRGSEVEHLFPLLLGALRADLEAAMRQASY